MRRACVRRKPAVVHLWSPSLMQRMNQGLRQQWQGTEQRTFAAVWAYFFSPGCCCYYGAAAAAAAIAPDCPTSGHLVVVVCVVVPCQVVCCFALLQALDPARRCGGSSVVSWKIGGPFVLACSFGRWVAVFSCFRNQTSLWEETLIVNGE